MQAPSGFVWAALIVVAVGAGAFFGFRPEHSGSPMFVLLASGPVVALGAFAIARAHRDGVLGDWLRPRWGDFSLAAIATAVLFALAYAFTRLVMAPGTPRQLWLVSLYAQIGDPVALQAHAVPLAIAIIVVALMEEVLWRGLVTELLAERIGSRFAWVWSAALYALAHVPTAWSLRAGSALNPVLVIAALGAGLFWGALVRRTGRLLPAVLSHALFDWVVIMMFPLWSAPRI